MGDAPADPADAEFPWSEPPSPTEEERDLPKPAAAPRSPRASPLLPEAAGGTLPGTESEEAPSDHPDGKRSPSWEEKPLFLGVPQPEGPTDHAGQEFTFLEVSGEGAASSPLVRLWGCLAVTETLVWGPCSCPLLGMGASPSGPSLPRGADCGFRAPHCCCRGPWARWVGGVGVPGLPGAGR